VSDEASYCGIRLYSKDHVLVRYAENAAGGGVTPGGLYLEHSRGLPACFGIVEALGPNAADAGIRKGQRVLFTRYAGEVTDILEDGSTFAVFDHHDLRGEYIQ
jgi:co-chaperonin GroES (HSP10)